LAFSAAVMAGLRAGAAREATAAGTDAEAGGDGGAADWADAAPASAAATMPPRQDSTTSLMGHRAVQLRCDESHAAGGARL
jgi:hypothetical protein